MHIIHIVLCCVVCSEECVRKKKILQKCRIKKNTKFNSISQRMSTATTSKKSSVITDHPFRYEYIIALLFVVVVVIIQALALNSHITQLRYWRNIVATSAAAAAFITFAKNGSFIYMPTTSSNTHVPIKSAIAIIIWLLTIKRCISQQCKMQLKTLFFHAIKLIFWEILIAHLWRFVEKRDKEKEHGDQMLLASLSTISIYGK